MVPMGPSIMDTLPLESPHSVGDGVFPGAAGYMTALLPSATSFVNDKMAVDETRVL